MHSLDELEARKRLIQAKMDIHRAEMAVHLHDITEPIRKVQNSVGRITHSPILRWGLISIVGWLAFSGRWRWFTRITAWVSPLALPQAGQFLKQNALTLGMKLFEWWRNRRTVTVE